MIKTDWTDIKADNKETPLPEFANSQELNNLITRGIQPPQPKPIQPIGDRYNPNLAYNQFGVVLDEKDKELVDVIKLAIKNGWNWREMVHESIIKGTEAESVVKSMKKTGSNVRTLLLNLDFAKALFGKDYQKELQSLVLESDIMKYLKGKLLNV